MSVSVIDYYNQTHNKALEGGVKREEIWVVSAAQKNITNTIVTTSLNFQTNLESNFIDTPIVVHYEYKFPKKPSKNKAIFKQSKFDQINSFGKKKIK